MGRKNNVNPDHYKTAGRERPGQAVNHEVNRQKFTQAMSNQDNRTGNFIPRENVTETPERENVQETGQANESADSSK